MSKQAPSLHQLQSAAKDCAQVFIKQQPKALESAIESCLQALDRFVELDSQFALLLLNHNDKQLSWLENVIIKQLLTTGLFGAKLSVLPKTIKTQNRVCLYLLYCLTPALMQFRKKQISAKQFQMLQKRIVQQSFRLTYQLKLQDKEAIKLLSQIAKTNKFHSSNQLIQVVTLLSFNTNLSINVPFTGVSLSFDHAVNEQLVSAKSWYWLENRFLKCYLPQLQTLSNESWFAGNLVFSPHLGYFIALTQSPDLENWYCLPFNPKERSITAEVIKLANYQITKVYPQFNLQRDTLWQCYLTVKSDWPLEDEHFVSAGYYDPLTLKYSVPDFWPNTTKALLNGNIKELSKAIDTRSEFRDILLTYASQANRNQLPVKSSKHAISLLGLDRIFPIITCGMMKLVEESFRFTGSNELNNKVDFISNIALRLAEKSAQHSLPEYHALLARLFALSLFTIPKVAFTASSHNKAPLSLIFPNNHHLSLAEIYQYPKLELWLKVTLHMIDIWKLPKVIRQFVSKYITALKSNVSPNFSALELEWLTLLEQTNLTYLTCLYPDLDKNLQVKVTACAQKHGLSVKQLNEEALSLALQLNIKTSLV